MKVGLLTDAPKHNLALMKISAFHRAQGDEIYLNHLMGMDVTYGSWLFDFSKKYPTDFVGGPGVNPVIRLADTFDIKPDYDLFAIDYSLGLTWEYCPRRCEFCMVPKQPNPKVHRSIWTFHDTRFDKICLLNNNTFSDPQWRQTFEEIWEAGLTVVDQNGYDLRLLDDEKAEALHRTKFAGYIHFAWDRMQDEAAILRGLALTKAHHFASRVMVYVLTGFDTDIEDDLYRCQKLTDLGFSPYIMPYRSRGINSSRARQLRKFKRFIDARTYRPQGLLVAWQKWQDKG